MAGKTDQLQTRAFWIAAGWRAFRSFCQSLLTLAGVNATELLTVNSATILLSACGYALTSLLTSILVGVPEVPATGPASLPNTDLGGTNDTDAGTP